MIKMWHQLNEYYASNKFIRADPLTVGSITDIPIL